MGKILIATHNQGKLREFSALLSPFGLRVVSPADLGITDEPEETGTSFEENAQIKSEAAYQAAAGGISHALADDSGLCVDALGGAPGIFSARFGGGKSDRERTELLLKQLEGVPEERRGAKFVCVLCFAGADGVRFFRGECAGRIGFSPRGENGFGYDPVFLYDCADGVTRSFAEIAPKEKNRISHRARALAEFETFLRETAPNYERKI